MGYTHPDELLPRLTSRQWTDWLAYARLNPFGPRRDDERAGLVATMIANASRDPKQRPEPFMPGDFFPTLAPEPVSIGRKLRMVFSRLPRKR